MDRKDGFAACELQSRRDPTARLERLVGLLAKACTLVGVVSHITALGRS